MIGKIYIGQTINFIQRKNAHFRNSKNPNSVEYNNYFHRAIRKYGWDKFEWRIILYNVPRVELGYWEKIFVEQFEAFGKRGYNGTSGGDINYCRSWESRRRISNTLIEYFKNPQIREKQSQAKLGKKNPMFGKFGEKNPNFGKHQSQEAIKNSSKAKIKYFSDPKNRLKSSLAKGAKPFNVYKKDTLEFVGTWISRAQCAEDLGCYRANINRCLRKIYKSANGYIFKHLDNEEK